MLSVTPILLTNSNSMSFSIDQSSTNVKMTSTERENGSLLMKGAKAEARLELLTDLRKAGKVLKEAVRVGKIVESQKQIPNKGGVDWSVVDFGMERKVADAREEVRGFQREKRALKVSAKEKNERGEETLRVVTKQKKVE